jgi:hypothetical protein
VAHQIIHLHDPWSTTYLAAPVGLQLGYHTLTLLLGVVMAPVTLAFGPSGGREQDPLHVRVGIPGHLRFSPMIMVSSASVTVNFSTSGIHSRA